MVLPICPLRHRLRNVLRADSEFVHALSGVDARVVVCALIGAELWFPTTMLRGGVALRALD